jgi:hypothetical protein
LGSKNRQKLEVDYVEYLEDVVKIWSQTSSGKLSKFVAKIDVKTKYKLDWAAVPEVVPVEVPDEALGILEANC